jgi:hypothetical protein
MNFHDLIKTDPETAKAAIFDHMQSVAFDLLDNYEPTEQVAEDEELTEGKFLETHKGEDAHGIPKPNPSHPAYAKHLADYKAKKATVFSLKNKDKEAKPTEESPVKLHHIDAAISNSYPDVEPYDHLARQFPALHKADGKTGSKLMDHLHAVVKKNKAGKDFHDYVAKAHADFEADAKHNNESVEEPLVEEVVKGSVKKDKDGNVLSFKTTSKPHGVVKGSVKKDDKGNVLSFKTEDLEAMTQEEFDSIDEEQLDELSKDILKSYIKKATDQSTDIYTGAVANDKSLATPKTLKTFKKRLAGTSQAVDKLTK